jgi:alkylated DNA repair dioxygenase AlkB
MLIDMAGSSSEAELREYLGDMIPPGTPGGNFQAEFLRRARAVSGASASENPKTVRLAPEQTEQKADPQPPKSKDGRKGKFGESTTFHIGGGEMSLGTVILPGRRPCKCQATRHKLIANCISCGRIVCEQEGPGPCLFCGDEVSTNSAVQSMARPRSEKEQAQFLAALKHRDKLLEYGRTAAKRTTVIDDQLDYFDTDAMADSWMTEEEKARIAELMRVRKEKEMRKRHVSITFDFAGRQVIEAPEIDEEELVLQSLKRPEPAAAGGVELARSDDIKCDTGLNPSLLSSANLSGRAQEIYLLMKQKIQNGADKAVVMPASAAELESKAMKGRVQHASLFEQAMLTAEDDDGEGFWEEVDDDAAPSAPGVQGQEQPLVRAAAPEGFVTPVPASEASDSGQALSMHQPWASLLLAGIKRVEGRSWPTEHRGWLWIASTIRPVELEEIESLEQQYITTWPGATPPVFPKAYPKSALLGRVWVDDCVPGESHRARCATNPSLEWTDCEFAFLCSRQERLTVPIRISGQHKLWKLDPNTLQAALRSLKPVEQQLLAVPLPITAGVPSTLAHQPLLDLYPSSPSKVPSSINPCHPIRTDRAQLLRDGVVLVKGGLSLDVQQSIVDYLRTVGLSPVGFQRPAFDNGNRMHCEMLCLGQHWNAVTSRYEPTRDGQAVAQIDARLAELVHAITEVASNIDPTLTPIYPDLCIANYYTESGRMGMHQDKDESRASIQQGLPVVSISIGDSGDFAFSGSPPSAALDTASFAQTVRLDSGDVLVFGGRSRLMWHGLQKVHAQSGPRELFMRRGRLNLTFRKM